MKTKQEIQKEIDVLVQQQKEQDEKIKLLQEQLNKPEKWQDSLVQPNQKFYWAIDGSIQKGFNVVSGNNSVRKPEHAFRTQEQAELIKEKMLLMQELYAFAHVKNEGKLPDWDNPSNKYGIDTGPRGCEVYVYNKYPNCVFGVSFNTRKDAEEALQIFGERIQKYYNKSY